MKLHGESSVNSKADLTYSEVTWELALGTLSFDTNENRLKKYIGNFLNDNINTIEELKTSKLN